MKKYILILATGLFIAAFLNSCYYDKEDFLYPPAPNHSSSCDTTNVTYSAIVKPIFDNNCIGCHGSGSAYNYDGYAALSGFLATNAQKLLDNINYTSSQQMPPSGKLDACYIKQITLWIQAGYPNN